VSLVGPSAPSSFKEAWHRWTVGLTCALITFGAVIGGSEIQDAQSTVFRRHVVGWICAGVIVVFGVIATRRLANALGSLVSRRSMPAGGAATRLVATGAGYVFVLFSVFAVLGVSVERLLIGAGLAGVVVGIAAQQSLGNIFASLVLVIARPFGVGDHIRIRSGALSGPLDVWVLAIDLAYVTVRTEDGILKIPNSVMLAAGVGQLDPPSTPADQ